VSEEVKCEHCGTAGRRRRGTMAPSGWLYLEAVDDEEGPSSTLIVWACSATCAASLWRPGPGKLDLGESVDSAKSGVAAERKGKGT